MLEVAALRRDGHGFGALYRSIPELGRSCLETARGTASYDRNVYLARFFDTFKFRPELPDDLDFFRTVYDDRVAHYRHGTLHSVGDQPAVWWKCGNMEWYWNGVKHRTCGPAVICRDDNRREWWWHGVLHRDDGPAVDVPNMCQEWWVRGKRHRVGAAAIQWIDGPGSWYDNGEIHRTDGPAVVDENGTEFWYLHGKQHRIGGPAIRCTNGDCYYMVNGQLHRTDGPAKMEKGDKFWYLYGVLYREYGPCIEYADGRKVAWDLYDKEASRKEVKERQAAQCKAQTRK